ncbi:uncharacterized protein [Littorina saxatilis]|uniref:uncharacterized protein n=1 Tax=Littorina saxatilis TaxID=31220 RepID=UPI0038B5B1CC
MADSAAKKDAESASTSGGQNINNEMVETVRDLMGSIMSPFLDKLKSLESKYDDLFCNNGDDENQSENSDLGDQSFSVSCGATGVSIGDCSSGATVEKVKKNEAIVDPGRGSVAEVSTESEFDFCVKASAQSADQLDDIFAAMEADLEVEEKIGGVVDEKLANITKSRFTVKLPDQKLKDKMESILIPANCVEIKAPILNEEVIGKANLDRGARQNDTRLLNVQKLISKSTAALVTATSKLHTFTKEGCTDNSSSTVTVESTKFRAELNGMLSACGDVICLLGTAQQELSIRRKYQLARVLPKDMAAICTNEHLPSRDMLFGGDIEKAIKGAKENYKMKTPHTSSYNNRFQPYQRKGHGGRPFLGQGNTYGNQRGQSFSPRARGRGQNRGFGKFRGKQ